MSLNVRGLQAGEDPTIVLSIEDATDQPASEIVSRARYAMAERCKNWTPSIGARWDEERWWNYRRFTHAYALLAADPPGLCDDIQHGSGVSRELLAEVPYPEHGELDWAALYARDLFQVGEDTRGDVDHIDLDEQAYMQARRTMIAACKPLGESTWGYRLEGIEPFELGELLPGLLAYPEFALHGLPAGDLSCYAVKWRWSKWESQGCVIHATIKPLSPKERSTWEAGPPPLFVITINGPTWLLRNEHERVQLLHHELCHAKVDITDDDSEMEDIAGMKPSSLPHDAEICGYTVARFGAMTVREARLIEAAWHNAHTQELLEAARRESLPSPFDLDRLNQPLTAVAELGEPDAEPLPEAPAEPVDEADPFAAVAGGADLFPSS